ncbi:MAG: zinc finger domain-containing protein, partial [Porticoccaceae bacterium]|nr:zinc finger domain-containing protein [Porticoccaceae bacterium]
GRIRSNQGFFTVQQTCPQCNGNGEEITNPCNDCNGQGKKQASKKAPAKKVAAKKAAAKKS